MVAFLLFCLTYQKNSVILFLSKSEEKTSEQELFLHRKFIIFFCMCARPLCVKLKYSTTGNRGITSLFAKENVLLVNCGNSPPYMGSPLLSSDVSDTRVLYYFIVVDFNRYMTVLFEYLQNKRFLFG